MTQWRYETREGRTPHNDIRRTDAPNKERVALWKRNTAKCTVKRGIRVIPQKSKLDAHGSQKNKNGYHTVAIRENENIRLSRKENKKKWQILRRNENIRLSRNMKRGRNGEYHTVATKCDTEPEHYLPVVGSGRGFGGTYSPKVWYFFTNVMHSLALTFR